MRDNFPAPIIRIIASKVNYICSNPFCGKLTLRPKPENINDYENLGIAAHITAASPKGPRFDPTMTSEQRKSEENGIWLCDFCARIIDLNPKIYSVELLRYWKRTAEEKTTRRTSIKEDGIGQIINDLNIAIEKLGNFIEEESDIYVSFPYDTTSDFQTRANEELKRNNKIRAKYIREVSPYIEDVIFKCRTVLGESDNIIKEMNYMHLPESAAVNMLSKEDMFYILQKLKSKLSML